MTRVARAVLHRLGGAVLVLWGAATLGFLALHLVPGDPVSTLLGGSVTTGSAAVRAEITREFGLDRPLFEQYLTFLGRLLGGDLGRSYQQQQPVSRIIGEQLGPTAGSR